MLRSMWFGTRALFRRRNDDAELSEEIRAYLENAAEQKMQAGMSREEAWRSARAELGSAEAVKDDVRDVGWESRFYSVAQDVRYALRVLKSSPGFTVVAVVSLALAIGANTALFSLYNAVFLKRLPVHDPGRLVLFQWFTGPREFDYSFSGNCNKQPDGRICTSFPTLAVDRMRSANQTLDSIFAFYPVEQLNVNIGGNADVSSGQLVSGDYFRGLDVPMAMGRPITPDDDRANAVPVAVITHSYWQKRFGSDPNAVGRSVHINNIAFTIVGVTAPGFVGALDEWPVDISIPIALDSQIRPEASRSSQLPVLWWWRVMGRRKAGVTLEQVHANFSDVFRQAAWDALHMGPLAPEDAAKTMADAPVLQTIDGSRGLTDERVHFVQPITILLSIVGLILLIACVNVANMLLARAEARQREIGVRLAIGAPRRRVIRQLLTESVLLASFAGLLGTGIAYALRNALVALVPWTGGIEVQIDWRVLAFTIGTSVVTGLLFGMAPALRASRTGVNTVLKDGIKGSMGRQSASLGKALVVVQVALSMVLVIAGGLFVRTLRNLEHVDYGFDANNLLLFRVDPRLSGYQGATIQPLYRRMTERLSAVPGVKAVTASRHPLLAGSRRSNTIHIDGRRLPSADVNVVAADFFETLGIPIIEGRGINNHDTQQSPHVAVINQAAKRKYFSGEDPVGRKIGLGFNNPEWFEIVGVSRDAKYSRVRQDMPATVYVALAQGSGEQANFELRTALEPSSLIPAVRAAVHEIDNNLPIFDLKTQVERANETISQERVLAGLSSAFGLLALALAAIGLFGVMSYAVARRTNEIAIRMALGARRDGVLAMVIGETLAMVVIGAAIGLPSAVLSAQSASTLLSSVLYGVKPTDPLTFVLASAGLLMIGVLAAYVPARRAAGVDPMRALRYE